MIHFIAGLFGALLALKRTCPECGREQFVPKKKQDETVNCTFCGAPIPPASKRSR